MDPRFQINEWIRQYQNAPHMRLLIVFDETTQHLARGFLPSQDSGILSQSVVQQLFDSTLVTLLCNSGGSFTTEAVPLSKQMGFHACTVITKTYNNSVSVEDGLQHDVDSHLGLG